ncbi:hypothetical protein [Alkaliphilus oremlandii]|uniref:hypothetical protein n=1 Tax=Alkaliphilus oremlandii TaxID=461876 RepID=UPI0018DBDBBE|nr:hypothetical protein [Alkaliphilus oremlandii]
MYDWIIVAFVAAYIFFMIRRGGCCGGHSNSNTHQSTGNKNCCSGNRDEINKG